MTFFKNTALKKAYLLFLLCLYLTWTIAELVLHPALNQVIPDGSALSQIVFDWILKNLLWTVPAYVMIKKFDKDLFISKQELFHHKTDWKAALPVILGEIAFCILQSVIVHRGFYFNTESLPECLSFVFVGIEEELVFRGVLLNAVVTEQNRYKAILVNAVLFLIIHFPIWILYGNFVLYMTNAGFLTILILSIFFSWSMLRFRNIWIPVIVHMLWDILVTILN